MRIAVAGGTGVVGRYVVDAATAAGHDVVTMARSVGIDVYTGDGLADALAGVDVVIDTTSPSGTDEAESTDFFTTSIANLGRVGAEAGVEHLVVLSIVGIDLAATGYYRAKLAQEAAARDGALPVTILRATQFHEFPAQMLAWTNDGTTAFIPDHRVQTVAARTVGEALVELATEPALGVSADLGGPEQAGLPTLARRFVEAHRVPLTVQAVASEIPSGALVPTYGARLDGPTFGQWLTSDDARRVIPRI